MNENMRLVTKRIKLFSVDTIKTAPYNPPIRTEHGSLSSLKASIARVGIIYPLIVNENRELIDGHRRLECAKMLGMKLVPVIVFDGERDALYEEVNENSRKLTRADDLYVYLCGGKLSSRSKRPVEILDKIMGREFLEELAENHISPSGLVVLMRQLMGYISDNGVDWVSSEDDFVKKTLRWIFENKSNFRVRAAIYARVNPKIIIACIESNVPLP